MRVSAGSGSSRWRHRGRAAGVQPHSAGGRRSLSGAELGSIVTVSENDTMPEAATAAGIDAESAGWLRALAGQGAARDAALARLHELLLLIARREVARRGP